MYCECSQSYRVCSKIHARTLVVSRAWIRKKWCGTHVSKLDGEWDKTAECMMLNFTECWHPVFRASNALERGELKSKGKGVKAIHFNGSEDTTELILRTVISVNQLSVYGAVAGFASRISQKLTRCRETRREWRFWNRWKYRRNFLLLTLFLGLMPK